MNATEIRELNKKCQSMALETKTVFEHSAGFQSLQCSLLAEIAAQLAQLNEGLETITTSTQSLKVQVEAGNYPLEVHKFGER